MNDPDERTIRGEAMTYTERWAAGTAAHVLLVEAEAELAELKKTRAVLVEDLNRQLAELAELRKQLREAGPAQQALYRSIEQRDKLTRELAELREELTNRNLLVNQMFRQNTELREAVRALKDQPCDTTIIVNRDVWNRLRQLIEEDERGPAATDSAISKERRGEKP